jgi:hypothetical protein
MAKELTEYELKKKLKALGDISDEQRNEIACTFIGHSRIISTFFGYIHCGRCQAQIGDQLGGAFDATSHVIIGHKCEKCVENAKTLTWRDTIFTPDPFAQEARR